MTNYLGVGAFCTKIKDTGFGLSPLLPDTEQQLCKVSPWILAAKIFIQAPLFSFSLRGKWLLICNK